MIRRACLAIEAWVDDESALLSIIKMMTIIALVVGLLISPFLWWVGHAGNADDDEQSRCLASGGGWAIVGEHRQSTAVIVGKVVIPQTRWVSDYGCVEVKR
jgi:nitrogen fixation-related uncharacterized protein